MRDFKKDWPDLLFKIIVAIVSVLLGSNQYTEHKEHQQMQGNMDQIAAAIIAPVDATDQFAHTDLLEGE